MSKAEAEQIIRDLMDQVVGAGMIKTVSDVLLVNEAVNVLCDIDKNSMDAANRSS